MILAGALSLAVAVMAALLVPAARTMPRDLPFRHPDVIALDDVGWPRSLWEWEALRAAVIMAAVLLALAAGLSPVAGVAIGCAGPSIVVRIRAERASRHALGETIRLLRTAEGALRSSAGLPEALRRGIEACPDPHARRPFVHALRAFDLGAPLDVALSHPARGSSGPARTALETLAIGVTERLPGQRAAQLLASAADRLAFQERLEAEVRARTNGLRVQVFVLALLVPSLAIYLALTVPTLRVTLESDLGRMVLVPGALALESVGIFLSRRAVNAALR